jgi:hypothetical protein
MSLASFISVVKYLNILKLGAYGCLPGWPLELVSEVWLNKFLEDGYILPRIKIENFLFVSLGLRPCSLMTLPAELPDANAIGGAIDEQVLPKLGGLRLEQDLKKKLRMIDALKKEMRIAYEENVKGSEQYKSHKFWIKQLGIRSITMSVRPTVEELYIFKENDIGKSLSRLMKDRERYRAEAMASVKPGMDKARFVYPEEFKASWLKEIGNILGYPECCIEAYASDREEGRNVEARASQQLKEAEERGVVDPFTYSIGYFFPCSPSCGKAQAKGASYRKGLVELLPSLGELYDEFVAKNMERVRHQPEIIEQYKARAEGLP